MKKIAMREKINLFQKNNYQVKNMRELKKIILLITNLEIKVRKNKNKIIAINHLIENIKMDKLILS